MLSSMKSHYRLKLTTKTKQLPPDAQELQHHGRRAGEEEKIEMQVVSGELTLICYIETYQL